MPGEYARPAIPEPIVGDYYYGRPPSKSAVARSYIQLLYRQRKLILTTFILIMAVGLTWVFTRPRMYQSVAELLVTPLDGGNNSGDNLAQDIGTMTRIRSVATQMKMISSPDLLNEAFANMPAALRIKGFRTRALELSGYPVEITNARDTDVITVAVTARNPEAAARFANQILRTNLRRTQETTQSIAQQATAHVDTQLSSCDTELRSTMHDLAVFKQQAGVVDISTQTAAEAQGLASLQSQAAQARSEAASASMAKGLWQREIAKTSPTIISSINEMDNPVVQSIDNDLARLQRERAAALQEYLPTAPEIRVFDQQIAELSKQKVDAMTKKVMAKTTAHNSVLDAVQQNYINSLVKQQESTSRAAISQAQANTIRGRLSSLPKAEERIALLSSRIAELQNNHAYLASQKQALTLTMSAGLPNTMPITSARANPIPVSPNIPASLLLLVLISGLIAIGLGVARDQLDDRVHTSETLESLTGRRVLATLPQVRNGFKGLVTNEACPAALLESFRILRGNILLSMLDPLPRVIMVTSAQAGDGKSTTVANLAATIAMSGKRVLIIDCDMRHPSIHLIHGLQNITGLSSILQGEAEVEACVQQTEIENMDILSAGPPPARPPELLASPQLGALLEHLREEYDCILLDSTPIVHLSDGVVLASLAEGAIIVVSSDKTRQLELQAALRTLEQVGIPILGLVYNRSTDIPELDWQR